MVAGISEVSDKIKQMNVDAVKSQDIPKTAVKHNESAEHRDGAGVERGLEHQTVEE